MENLSIFELINVTPCAAGTVYIRFEQVSKQENATKTDKKLVRNAELIK